MKYIRFVLFTCSGYEFPVGQRPDRGLPHRLLQRELLQDVGLQPRRSHAKVLQSGIHVRRVDRPKHHRPDRHRARATTTGPIRNFALQKES